MSTIDESSQFEKYSSNQTKATYKNYSDIETVATKHQSTMEAMLKGGNFKLDQFPDMLAFISDLPGCCGCTIDMEACQRSAEAVGNYWFLPS
jgi:hypothetical protein